MIDHSPKSNKTQCLNYSPYVALPIKRASYYDFVLIDGLCKQYVAYYVCIVRIDDN